MPITEITPQDVATTPVETTETPTVDQSAPEPPAAVTGAQEAEPDTYPAEHVHELRDEIAKRRIKAKEIANDANVRLLAALAKADGRLVEVEMLPLSDGLLGDDGFVDGDKVSEAITSMIAARPFLAAAKAPSSIPLGVRQDPPASVGLFSLMNQARGDS